MRILPRAMDRKGKAAAAVLGVTVLAAMRFVPDVLWDIVPSSSRGGATRAPQPRNGDDTDGALTVYIPPSLDEAARRHLSLDLGGGLCKWQPPEYTIPNDITFYKTLIAGFPSSDKRMTYAQMEALTGWAARDEWDFVFYGGSNHPFIKSNYPHHEGYWSWGSRADQVVLVLRNMRKTMVEYHDVLWDIATAKLNSRSYRSVLYRYRPLPITSFLQWRDLRVMDEIHWYGWFIDYWMEGGLRRDVFGNRLTSEENWPYFPDAPIPPECLNDPWHAHKTSPNTCTNNGDYIPPTPYPSRSPTPAPTDSPSTLSPSATPTLRPTPNVTDANYTHPPTVAATPPPSPPAPPPPPAGPGTPPPAPYLFNSLAACCQGLFPSAQCLFVDVCPTPSPTPAFTASYDPHCTGGEIANGCEPVAVISAEKLRDPTEGPAETQAIANVLAGHEGISNYLIDSQAYQCIWDELITYGKGIRMKVDRPGWQESDYNFSVEMLDEMYAEYNRLISKYNQAPWTGMATGIRLVQLLMEHQAAIQAERNEVASGTRMLTERDFLGPQERERRRRLAAIEEGRDPEEDVMTVEEKREHFEYFTALEEKVKTQRRAQRAKERHEERKNTAKENSGMKEMDR